MRQKYFKTTLKLLLFVVHKIVCSNFTVSVLDGEVAMLPCILPPQLVENNTVYWNYGEKLVSEGENITISESRERFSLYRPYNSDWYLRISPSKMADEGVYKCRAREHFISAAQLTVESPPNITGYDSNKLYIQACNTARVTLYCNVTGKPPPTIRWYKRLANDKLKYLELNTESIFIPEVAHSNAGVYLCQVSNKYGQTDMEFHISVVDLVTILKTDDASKAPRQGQAAGSVSVHRSGNNIYCIVLIITPFLEQTVIHLYHLIYIT